MKDYEKIKLETQNFKFMMNQQKLEVIIIPKSRKNILFLIGLKRNIIFIIDRKICYFYLQTKEKYYSI